MLEKIIDKRNYIILGIILVLITFIIANWGTKIKEQSRTFYYFSETLTIKVYNHKDITKDFEKIDSIYKKYNGYYKNIKKNKLDDDLKNLLAYGKSLYKKSEGLIDITTGELISNISDNKEYAFKSTIEKLNISDKATWNNINLDSIIGGYATKEVQKYLEEQKISKYVISENGNIVAGDYYDKGKYAISINDTEGNVIDVVYLQNESMVTRRNLSTFESYMVNPLTSKKSTESKMVVVIAKDINEATMLGNILYLLDTEQGKKIIKQYDAEALWHTNDGKNITTENFDKYTKKP